MPSWTPERYSRGALGIRLSLLGRHAPAIGIVKPRKTVRSGGAWVGVPTGVTLRATAVAAACVRAKGVPLEPASLEPQALARTKSASSAPVAEAAKIERRSGALPFDSNRQGPISG